MDAFERNAFSAGHQRLRITPSRVGEEFRRLCRVEVDSLLDSGRDVFCFGLHVQFECRDAELEPLLELVRCSLTPVGWRRILFADFAYTVLTGVVDIDQCAFEDFPCSRLAVELVFVLFLTRVRDGHIPCCELCGGIFQTRENSLHGV